MKRRIKKISTTCKSQYSDLEAAIQYNSTLKNILVSNRYKALFCFVPKVASSNWKRVFLVLNGHYNNMSEISRTTAHETSLLDKLDRYSKEEIRNKLEAYKKIMFVRDPLVRVVSAYKNKIEYDYGRKFHHRFGKQIIKKYRKNLTREVTDEDHATFNEFVKYLIDLKPKQYRDIHWEEQNKICSPCSINYDFIGKFESLKSDAEHALRIMGASDKITFPDILASFEKQKTKTLLKQFYSQISQWEFVRLEEMYEKDYELFEYHKPSYYEVIDNQ